MVKTPNVRHSKPRRPSLTIDLEPSRLDGGMSGDVASGETTRDTAGSTIESAQVDDASRDAADVSAGESDVVGKSDAADASTTSEEATQSASASTSGRSEPGEAIRPSSASATTSSFGRGGGDGPTTRPAASQPEVAPRRGGGSALAAGIIGAVVALLLAGALQYAGVLPGVSGAKDDTQALQAMSQQIADLRAKVDSQTPAGTDPAVTQSLADLAARVEKLAADVDAAGKSTGGADQAALAALRDKVAEIESKLGQIGAATDAANSDSAKVAALEQAVASLTTKVDAQASQPKIALAIAAAALKSAVERGQPFISELETLAAIAPNLSQIEALRAYAATGAPTQEQLVAEMEPAANAMIAAGKPVDEDTGYLHELWASAASLVTVRPVGAVSGAGVPETVARMEVALKAGDLPKALAEYDTLPDTAKQAGAPFAGKLKARLDVDKLSGEAIAEAMKSV